MHLIFGGAYQGKLDYAKERYQLGQQDIFSCTMMKDNKIDFSKKVICDLEEFILCCVQHGMEAKDYLEANQGKWKDKIFICADISAGIVPCEPELRAWREMTGRTLMYLGKEAEEVTRMFCGIPQRIK